MPLIYASETIQLMAALPTRPFRMIQIRRYVEVSIGATDKHRKEAVRIGVGRVIVALIECGAVKKVPDGKRILYQWNSAT
jgi:hypothetical protein